MGACENGPCELIDGSIVAEENADTCAHLRAPIQRMVFISGPKDSESCIKLRRIKRSRSEYQGSLKPTLE